MIEQTPLFSYVFSVIVIFFLLGVFLEINRDSTNTRKVLRVIAIAILSLGLLGVINKPKSATEINGSLVVYLTEGYDVKSLDSLLILKPNLKIYAKDTMQNSFPKASSIAHTLLLEKKIDTLFVLGFGLEKEEQDTKVNIEFLPSHPTGIIGIDYPKDLMVGDSAWVVVYTRFKSPTKVSITSINGEIDTLRVTSGYDSIHYKMDALLEGTHFIKLAYQKKELRVEEKLGIRVLSKPSYRILILNEYPSFESRYLKNWLGNLGHQVTVRNKISKEKYRYEYINGLSAPFNRFDNNYDLVVLDSRSLTGMSKGKLQDLRDAIFNGTSLFIQAEDILLENKEFNNWFQTKPAKSDKFNFNKVSLPKLSYQLLPSRFHTSIITEGDQTLVQKTIKGEGAIVVSLVTSTYPLILQGYDLLYDSYWIRIFNSLFSSKTPLTQWTVDQVLPIQNHPIDISLVTAYENPYARVDSVYFPLIRNINYMNQWDGTLWPDNVGWTKLSVEQDSINYHREYIYSNNSWRSLRNFEKVKETMSLSKSTVAKVEKPFVEIEITMWLWYSIIMISLLFLWVEPKF